MEAEDLRGVARTVDAPAAALEHGLDMPAFDLLQRRVVPGHAPHGRARTLIEEERAARRVEQRALDHVLELADVAGPLVPLQDREHLRGVAGEPVIRRARRLTKNHASRGMWSVGSGSGGSAIGNTLRRR